MWVKGVYHAHACVFKNATAAGWGAASSCSSTAEPMGQAERVRECVCAPKREWDKSPAFTVIAISNVTPTSSPRGMGSPCVSICVWHFVSDVLVNGTIKPSPMLFLTLCLHGNQHICWERCTLLSVCVCGDAAVHPASSGGSTHTLRMPAAVCVRVWACVLWGQIKSQNHIWLTTQKQFGKSYSRKWGGGIHKPVAGSHRHDLNLTLLVNHMTDSASSHSGLCLTNISQLKSTSYTN